MSLIEMIADFFGKKIANKKLKEMEVKKNGAVIHSHTSEFSTPAKVFLYILNEYEAKGGEFATFNIVDNEDMYVQIICDDSVTFNIFYPFTEEPQNVFASKGVALPQGYEFSDWEAESYVMFSGPYMSFEVIAAYIDIIFSKLLNVPEGYKVCGYIE